MGESPHPLDDDEEKESKKKKEVDEQFCSACGEAIKKEAEVCPHCGVRQKEDSSGADGMTAVLLAVLGFFIPIIAGAGQVANGETGKGIAITLIQLLNVALTFLVIGLVTYPIVGAYAIYDAHKGSN